jgi:uracil-DNA glycosylase
MKHPWPEMKWWDSGERQVVEEKIDDLERAGNVCNPKKPCLYRALRVTPERAVRVAIFGQDPYPAHSMATGIAFSIPVDTSPKDFPHTLKIIFQEYCSDLSLPSPSTGDLSPWTRQGVLLWNSIPSCQSGKPLSNDWDEWRYLTSEIVDRLDKAGGVVFVCLGNVAASFIGEVDLKRNRVIRTSHPSPRGIRSSKSPFTGSRIFSEINRCLIELGREKIDWRLDRDEFSPGNIGQGYIPPEQVRGNILPNVTGASLGGLRPQGTSPNIYTSLLF